MNEASNGPDNRADKRIFLGSRALFYTNKIEGSGVVANLSPSGAFLSTRAKLSRGNRVRIIVFLGEHKRQELVGVVVRQNHAGFAIRFDDRKRIALGSGLKNSDFHCFEFVDGKIKTKPPRPPQPLAFSNDATVRMSKASLFAQIAPSSRTDRVSERGIS